MESLKEGLIPNGKYDRRANSNGVFEKVVKSSFTIHTDYPSDQVEGQPK